MQQTTKGNADGDLLSSLQTKHRMAGQSKVISKTAQDPMVSSATALSEHKTTTAAFLEPQQQPKSQIQTKALLAVPAAVKKQGVSGESSDSTGQLSRDILIPKYDKDFRYVR